MGTTPFLDFQAIKRSYSIEELMTLTGLSFKKDGKGYRCECPVHKGGSRSLIVSPQVADEKGDGGVFFCHSAEVGGDRVALLAHVRDSKPYGVFKELAERRPASSPAAATPSGSARPSSGPAPKPEERPDARPKKEGGERAFYLPVYVSYDHEAVTEKLQVTPELAKSLGIAFWPRGYHGKRVSFLLRHEDGRNAGCISLPVELVNELLLPPKWF